MRILGAPQRVIGGLLLIGVILSADTNGGELVGVTVTPHRIEPSLRYRRPPDPNLAARVQLFVRGPVAAAATFAGRTPDQLLEEDAWAWHVGK
jgi:hypothetical protein